jgi:hypothetical protein
MKILSRTDLLLHSNVKNVRRANPAIGFLGMFLIRSPVRKLCEAKPP